MTTRILALVGSLRAGSYNRQLAEAAAKHAPEGTDVEIFEGLAEVPFYNEDLDRPGALPGPVQALRDAVGRADALLLVTPEYNQPDRRAQKRDRLGLATAPEWGTYRQAGGRGGHLQWALRRGVGA